MGLLRFAKEVPSVSGKIAKNSNKIAKMEVSWFVWRCGAEVTVASDSSPRAGDAGLGVNAIRRLI